jgi:histidyl-tRNA synthetase
MHRNELNMPFKRYHIAKVWRGENSQKGRYREFTQCDFDCIGSDSAAADFEILLMMNDALRAVADGVTIHVNHRGLFNRFLQHINAKENSVEVLRTVDKLAKIGSEEVQKILSGLLDADRAKAILNFIQSKGNWDENLCAMTSAAGGEDTDTERLKTIRKFMYDTGTEDVFVLDPSITRGLDYYTGIVFETFLNDIPQIGSVCSGGRYDNLLELYSKESLSGVGASIGLDRLIAGLESINKIEGIKTYAALCIANLDAAQTGRYHALAAKIRNKNIPGEVLSETKKLTAQFIDAEKRGASFVIIPAANDPANTEFTLRSLADRKNTECVTVDTLKDHIQGNNE